MTYHRNIEWKGIDFPLDYDEFYKYATPVWELYHKRGSMTDEEYWIHVHETDQKEDPTGRFRTWVQSKTGIFTWFPTDFAIYAGRRMSLEDFIPALYGVTVLSLNSGWMSELNDCPEEWYENERRKEAADKADKALVNYPFLEE